MTTLDTTAAARPGDDGARKARILAALTAFARQRPGFEPRCYGSRASYDGDRRKALRQLRDVERLAAAVAWRSVSAAELVQAARGGRLSITECDDGAVRVDYCTGQYFPTEFRAGVARVLAGALWDWTREHAMPEPRVTPEGNDTYLYRGARLYGGDWLRAHFRAEFGRSIAARYFD
jgi:hypothetical protein